MARDSTRIRELQRACQEEGASEAEGKRAQQRRVQKGRAPTPSHSAPARGKGLQSRRLSVGSSRAHPRGMPPPPAAKPSPDRFREITLSKLGCTDISMELKTLTKMESPKVERTAETKRRERTFTGWLDNVELDVPKKKITGSDQTQTDVVVRARRERDHYGKDEETQAGILSVAENYVRDTAKDAAIYANALIPWRLIFVGIAGLLVGLAFRAGSGGQSSTATGVDVRRAESQEKIINMLMALPSGNKK